ncbi:glutathione S-transferase family protein [Neoroseomonas soli]|uniref:Glutathione S-transferase family protein n=1 Tax=Neoroseomonas soli TaxID=1081025 RepID=A0A9X9WSY4_9PROT|nr:glutathione S-transferase family protein [Neoroseomonas soli]MBR0670263.1 glutathione S-transferase family protein [Neoroseomonas soli]
MPVTLYDLCGADPARRFSPYCWRTRLALAHKGFEVETIPWRFRERATITAHGAEKVPVILDGGRAVSDSWRIAEYLEDTYPERPSLFGGEGGRALARFLNGWADAALVGGMARLVVSDIPALLDPEDAAYFIESREARYARTLPEVTAGRETTVAAFRETLVPLRLALRRAPFLHGDAPGYGDAVVFGPFQWARCVSPFPVLEPSDPVHAWRERMLDAYGGIARAAPAFAEA